jgi:hypothetical protein
VRVGRKSGVPNNFTRELKEALLDAAEEVGEVEEEEILDKDGNSTGKFIGSLRLLFTTISI